MTNYDILVVCVVYYRILNERTCVAVCFYFWLLWCFYCLFFDFLLHFCFYFFFFFFSSRRRHTRWTGDWGSDVCSSDLLVRPRDRDQLASAVGTAAAEGRAISVAGSGHSFTEAAMTDGTMIDLGALSGVIDADPADRKSVV